MICPNCGTENAAGRKFCGGCAAPLARACPVCGAANEPGMRFCGECAHPLDAEASAPQPDAQPVVAPSRPGAEPTAERRLVTVLFADLVGFTSASDGRDAEDTRELLTSYFELSRKLIERYGGTIEKFIGDAVMAVWGTPTTTEDDAERAVRAALDLVASVPELDPTLQARAGVLTGEAAVTLGADGQGMVAGDLVNTASRVQSAAPPGAVFVGESTKRAAEETIVFDDAGQHELKGKAEPVHLWQALRVVAGVGGALRSHGLEAPFVGRDRELRQIKDLFHTSAEEKKAHLVSVTGIAGIGKSRLAWEFYKYFDGLTDTIYWHRGRCLAYGEGVAYWALADMVRMRARIAEDEDVASALEKLQAVLDQHIPDADERAFVEPRLTHLLGLAEHEARDKQDLFAAWRIFFERLADVYPTVLAFEDMQWADASLLDFVEYLVEWSRNHPLYVITLARPELIERRPTWGAGKRNFTSLYLEPLSHDAMTELLAGLVPGLPAAMRDRILNRAEGVPLYAVETVRMLLDRGLLVEEGSVYKPAGEIDTLDVPETLHALIAARLDNLGPDERRVLQDGAVLGKTFTPQALASLSGRTEQELGPLLASLVRKEVLSLQSDPRSPEHGQYGFLQDLVRHVAYETLSRRDRKARHLAAAAHLAAAIADEDEVVEVVASHYYQAYEAAPDDADAAEIAAKAGSMLVRAAERAASLAANVEAQRYYEQAAGLAEDQRAQADLRFEAGQMAWREGDVAGASAAYDLAFELYTDLGDAQAAGRVAGRRGLVDMQSGHLDVGIERLERALEALAGGARDEDYALMLSRLGNAYFFVGKTQLALKMNDEAHELAEALGLPRIVTRTLATKATFASFEGRSEEAIALLTHAAKLAVEIGEHTAAYSGYFNLSDVMFRRDQYESALHALDQARAATRRAGDRLSELESASERTYPLFMLGRWDEAVAERDEIPDDQIRAAGLMLSLVTSVLEIHLHRGQREAAQHLFELFGRLDGSADVQEQAGYDGARAAMARAEGRFADALAAGAAALAAAETLGANTQAVKQGIVEAAEAALALRDETRVEELLGVVEEIPPGRRSPYLQAQAARLRARLDRLQARDPEAGLKSAAKLFDTLGIQFWAAVTRLEHAEWLAESERHEEAAVLAASAQTVFDDLGATPWMERAARVSEDTPAVAAASA